jgi:primosomal protein N' (replication factor Y)
VDLVGILGIDIQMGLPDFRASERCFQNIIQVAGRAGRTKDPSKVLIQSFEPHHPAIQFAMNHDYHGFADAELKSRQSLNYPPFERLAEIRISSNSETQVKAFIDSIKSLCRKITPLLHKQGVRILGPTEMSVFKLRNRYRYHLFVKAPRNVKIQKAIHYILTELEPHIDNKPIQVLVDVDPLLSI